MLGTILVLSNSPYQLELQLVFGFSKISCAGNTRLLQTRVLNPKSGSIRIFGRVWTNQIREGFLIGSILLSEKSSANCYSRERQPKSFLLSKFKIIPNSSTESKIGLHTYFWTSLDQPKPGGIFDSVNTVVCRACPDFPSRPNKNLIQNLAVGVGRIWSCWTPY